MTSKKPKSSASKRRAKRLPVRISTTPTVPADIDNLFGRVSTILEKARSAVVRSVNTHMVLAYWQIGREIVESLQGGDDRAEYGRAVIDRLSERLTEQYGRGFSTTNLRYFRSFHQVYAGRRPEIRHIRGGEFGDSKIRHIGGGVLQDLAMAVERHDRERGFSPMLGWAHYRALMTIEHPAERLFYEIEAEKERWSAENLEQQIHGMLFARLLKSRNKAGVLELARKGHEILRPADALKDPYVLDFLALPDGVPLRETDLETAIIAKLQSFLLELGKGFAFVARQKRIAFEDEHFYVDLVFYHTILKCYLLIDLKIGKLMHQDIGQMDSYVRLFDDQFTTKGDGPTIGLVLCAEKNEAVARYSILHKSKQVFAAKYLKHLPSEAELKREIERERRMLENQRRTKKH